MNIVLVREDAERIVASLAEHLEEANRISQCELFADRAKKKLELLRKEFQRTIDQRLLERPGQPRFSIHAHRGIQKELDQLVSQTLTQIDDLAIQCRQRFE